MSEEQTGQVNVSKVSTDKKKQTPRRNNHHPRRRSKSNQQRNNKSANGVDEEKKRTQQAPRAKQAKSVTTSEGSRQNRSEGQHHRHRSPRKPSQASRQANVQTAEKTANVSHSGKTNPRGAKCESESKKAVSRSHRNRLTTSVVRHSSMSHSKSETQYERNATTVPSKVADEQVSPAKSEEIVVRANLDEAFVNHEPEKLAPQARQALHVFVRNLRQVRQLRRFGDIEYISKKLHYVVIYMGQDDISRNQQAINKLSFVRRVMVSERPEIDPFVGEGVNANFVTHTKNDGAADAIPDADQTAADHSGSAATKSTEAH